LWQYREMLYLLITRDITVRYRQTVLGAAWAIIQPLSSMVVFTIFFGGVAKIPSNGIPYPLFAFAALVPWTFFANGVAVGADSLVGQAHLVRKVYFPRMLIPLARILGGLVDFSLALLVLLAMMPFFHYTPSPAAIVVIPALSLLTAGLTFGMSLWLSALNVKYRDIRYLVPYLMQIWMFATPIAYPSTLIEEPTRTLYSLNPMVSVVEGFRSVLLNSPAPSGLAIAVSVVVTVLLVVTGVLFFHHAEGIFADVI